MLFAGTEHAGVADQNQNGARDEGLQEVEDHSVLPMCSLRQMCQRLRCICVLSSRWFLVGGSSVAHAFPSARPVALSQHAGTAVGCKGHRNYLVIGRGAAREKS